MYIPILLVALIAHTAFSAPTNCGDYCDDQSTVNYGHAKSSYSSYSKSSSYGQQRMHRLSNGGGFGSVNGRLETFDDNIIGTSGLNRPGNWKDEKHYVTDDGRGEMNYRAGQTVTNNGYSKYAQHSYSYGTNDRHAPLSNSQILSSSEFNNELQNIRSRINNFMGSFNFGSDSAVNSNLLQEFKNKASLISSQMNSVCDQVGVGNSMYDQMQQMIQEFQRNVEQKQREMEAIIFQSTSSSSTSMTQESYRRVPTRPTISYQSAPTIINYPTRPTVHEDNLLEQRVEEQLTSIQSLISSFYTNFNHPNADFQYQQDLNDQVNIINQKLNDLTYEAAQNESTRTRIESLKSQFESHVSQIRSHIQEIEARNQEEEQRRQEREQRLLLEKKQHEEKMRKLEEERRRQENERIRLQQEAEERRRQQEFEDERIRLQQEAEERRRQQEFEDERIRLQQEIEEKKRQQELEEERIRLQEVEEKRIQQENERFRKQQLEEQRIKLQQEHARQLSMQQQQVTKPQMSGSIEVTGSSSYEHSIKGIYQSSASGGSQGTLIQGSQRTHTVRPQPLQPHVDLTAAMSRLQQDLNRLQNEVNNFNRYTMRLTSSNTASVVTEAERQAETLRQNINNLCERSSKYDNQDILSSAQELKSRFEELFQSFQSQAAGYSSEMSYSSSGRYSNVRKPSLTNIEVEHSKSTEIEIGRRPASSQRRTSSIYSASTGVYPGSEVENQLKHGIIDLGAGSDNQQVDCVEMYAGQPCVNQSRRYRRHVGGK